MITLLTFVLIAVLSLPGRNFKHTPSSDPIATSFTGFSKAETSPDGAAYSWALAEPSIVYPRVPRYTPLNFKIKLNLTRPDGAAPAHIEIFENLADPPGNPPKLLATIDFDPNRPGPQEYNFSIPARESGTGLVLEFHNNAFSVPGDNRKLGFIFQESQLTVPQGHFFKLFYPYPYWPACLIVLVCLAAWFLRAGLTFWESFLLVSAAGFIMMTAAESTYQASGWLALVALAFGAVFWFDGWLQSRKKLSSSWVLLGATAVLLVFFLFSNDYHQSDIRFYFRWGAAVHDYGLWNVYSHAPDLNYLPLLVYVLWIYNLVIYPLGLQQSFLAWRITASLMFLASIFIINLQLKARPKLESNESEEQPAGQKESLKTRMPLLELLAFNIGFFFNSTVWGQSDMLAVLVTIAAFYFIFRRKALTGGVFLGLAAISKPQVWFMLPLLAWMLVQRCGGKRGGLGVISGGVVALVLVGIAFGLDPASLSQYLNNPEFGGTYINKYPTAFNFNYLVIGSEPISPPGWLSVLGFVVMGAIMLGVILGSSGKDRSLKVYGLGSSLLILTSFSWLIKMKERYLLFSLPFLGMTALSSRRFVRPFLVLSWLQLLHLVAALYDYSRWKQYTLDDYPFVWSILISNEWLKRGLSVATLALFGYLAFAFWQESFSKKARPAVKPAEVEVA